jgi:starch-binding outer membrane protein, SusD/RagB family
MRMHTRKTAGVAGRSRAAVLGAVAAGALALGACDLGVTNPALIEEADLYVPGAVPSIVNGARYTWGMATTIQGAGGVYSVSAILTDELTHVGSWTPPREIANGIGGNESPENQSHWGFSSRARWQAEDAIDKVSGLVENPNSNPWLALAMLYAGFSNRLLGDMFCEAVIDGGPLLPHTAFHERGEGHFNNAIAVATASGIDSLRYAAYGGRAQVRMMLGDWAGAVADAGQVPTGFVYWHIHSDNSASEANGVFEWSAITAGQYAVWATPFAEWGLDVSGTLETEGDPRAPFLYRDEIGGGSPARPYWFAQKYTSRNDNIAIVKGTEMRLIEAEALLRGGSVGGAVDKINEVRAHRNLDPASAGTPAEAWQLLMKERGLELWLEGRRLPDLRRWAANADTRAQLTTTAWGRIGPDGVPVEQARPVYEADPLCLRISTNEIFSNRNLWDNPPT